MQQTSILHTRKINQIRPIEVCYLFNGYMMRDIMMPHNEAVYSGRELKSKKTCTNQRVLILGPVGDDWGMILPKC